MRGWHGGGVVAGVERQSAVTGREDGRVVRTGERPRPEWEGLFREPDWPPEGDEDAG